MENKRQVRAADIPGIEKSGLDVDIIDDTLLCSYIVYAGDDDEVLGPAYEVICPALNWSRQALLADAEEMVSWLKQRAEYHDGYKELALERELARSGEDAEADK